jgi:hypothetical protein
LIATGKPKRGVLADWIDLTLKCRLGLPGIDQKTGGDTRWYQKDAVWQIPEIN